MKQFKTTKKKNPIINNIFIEKWHPRYDEIENDEKQYEKIIASVSDELSQESTILRGTFIDILNWKSPRVRGIVRMNEFNVYADAFRQCFNAQDNEKLAILDKLYGVGVPVASTILHFMYPNCFPIMDIRTVETLYYAGYIESKTISQEHYCVFRAVILEIAKDNPKWSLRQIDRALFAYHKIHLRLNAERCL